jgi:NAD(P)H-dependent flavin oxidoreductase YrpB (nitropropane dioxygenase family)
LAIVSSNTLAKYLLREEKKSPNGFIIESPTAGGHNAPPRGSLTLNEDGEPIYGERDEVGLLGIAKLGHPFWLAGNFKTADGKMQQASTPEGLRASKIQGAKGIQVGSIFALCEDSGFVPEARHELVDQALGDGIKVVTSATASSTGYPFKVAQLEGTLSDEEVYKGRKPVCDLGFLCDSHIKDGKVIFSCPAEPVDKHLKKGGQLADTIARLCLCNGLLATVGLGQVRINRATGEEYHEPPVFTLGDGVNEAVRGIAGDRGYPRFWAKDVLAWLRTGGNELQAQ